jgi:hypothetical protein
MGLGLRPQLTKQAYFLYQKILEKIMDPFEFICGSFVFFFDDFIIYLICGFYCEMQIWYAIHAFFFQKNKKYVCFAFNSFYRFIH